MELFIIENYKSIFPELKGSELTDRLVARCVNGTIERAESGKPFIAGGPHISVSHTGKLFALLVADCNVGLDIQMRKNLDAGKIAGRFFSPEEAELVKAAVTSEGENPDVFFSLWTRKEAYAKYTGRGLRQVASGLDMLKPEDVEFRELKLELAGDGIDSEDCFCAVCAEKGAKLDEIQISYRKQDR